MEQRPVYVKESNGAASVAAVVVIGVIVIAALVALFIWQPWSAGAQHNTTIVTTPGTSTGSGAGTSGGSGSSGSGSSGH